jgi:hypothetical protein
MFRLRWARLKGGFFQSSSLEEPMSKALIQYKCKGRKPKSTVGQGEKEDMGFLRQGFIKSSSSSLPLANRGVSGGDCSSRARPLNSASGPQFLSPMEWSMFCSSMVRDKGARGGNWGLPLCT